MSDAHDATGLSLAEHAESEAVAIDHFPDRLHAFVWRNWHAVPTDRLAEVLGTTADNVAAVAAAMGLPPARPFDDADVERGYITVIRRNWHLLPFDQLLTLLGLSDAELAHRLREDDFLWAKLGGAKPRCAPLRWEPPSEPARRRAAQIAAQVQRHFGDARPAEPRFSFVRRLARPPADAASRAAEPGGSGGPRYIYAYFALFGDPLSDPALDPYPDGLLHRLRDVGVNGVWLHVVLNQLAPGGSAFPEFGEGHERRLASLGRLVERAGRFGIRIYLYLNEPRAMPSAFFRSRPEMAGARRGDWVSMCTSHPTVRAWLADACAHVFGTVPGLGGAFTITASENQTNCASHNAWHTCPRCRDRGDARIIAEVNATIAAGVHRAAPDAHVLAWDWGWRNHGDATEIIDRLPQSVWVMSASEWRLPIERGGVASEISEYAMSAVGPGPRARAHWARARQAGLRAAAKVQLNNTWELSAVPCLPVLDLVAEHCRRLAECDVDGMMLSWSLGGYPSPNLDVARRFQARPTPEVDTVLDAVARERFGEGAAHARAAWTAFSRAFGEYPYAIEVVYHCPVQMGPANLLHARPTGQRATMTGLPYDDLDGWRGPYPPEVFADQFAAVATGWERGLHDLERAAAAAPAERGDDVRADLRYAEAAHLHFHSVANQARFVIERDRLAAATEAEERRRLVERLGALVLSEIDLARRLHRLTCADSCIGFEAANQYFYLPHDLIEKVINCEAILEALGA